MKDMMKSAEDDYRKFAKDELGKLIDMYNDYDSKGVSANVLEGKPRFLETKEVLELVEGVINKGTEIFGSDEGKPKEIFQEEFKEVLDRINKSSIEKAMKELSREDKKEGSFDVYVAKKD